MSFEKCEQLKKLDDHWSEHCEKLVNENRELKQDNEIKTAEIKKQDEWIIKVEKRIDELANEKIELSKQIDIKEEQIKLRDQRIEKVEANKNYDDENERLYDENRELTKEVERLTAKIENLKEKYEQAVKDLDIVKDRNGQTVIENKVEENEENMTSLLKILYDNQVIENNKYIKQIKRLTEDSNEITDENNEFNRKNNELTNRLNELWVDTEQNEKDLKEEFKQRTDNFQDQIKDLIKKYEQAAFVSENLKRNFKIKEDENRSLKEQNQKIKQDLMYEEAENQNLKDLNEKIIHKNKWSSVSDIDFSLNVNNEKNAG